MSVIVTYAAEAIYNEKSTALAVLLGWGEVIRTPE